MSEEKEEEKKTRGESLAASVIETTEKLKKLKEIIDENEESENKRNS